MPRSICAQELRRAAEKQRRLSAVAGVAARRVPELVFGMLRLLINGNSIGEIMLRHFIIALALTACLTCAGLTTAQAQDQPAPAASATPPAKNDYANGDTWLCRPGRQDACSVDPRTTGVGPEGKITRGKKGPKPKRPVA